MSVIINAFDTPLQKGENAQSEYGWSNSIREKIIQFHFQLTRTSKLSTSKLAHLLDTILREIAENAEYLSIMYRIIAQTRDIIDGKGEYDLAYMQLLVWSKHYPDLAKLAFRYFVLGDNEMVIHPYGSWKDVKHLIKYIEINEKQTNEENVLISYAIKLVNTQLREDVDSITPSLVAKWIPREKSQHSKLFSRLAYDYFPNYIQSATTSASLQKAKMKSKMEYRRLISSLNKKLNTVQINQCANNWAQIEPTTQTSITLHKQKKAFLNITKQGSQRTILEDRIECAHKFEAFALQASKGKVAVKGKRVGLNDFTSEAISLISTNQHLSSQGHLLNAQWNDNSTQTGALGKMVAMVDVSGSMDGDPLHAAIALGIRIAEKSALGRRVLTFSDKPAWVNLNECSTFISSVEMLRKSDWGMNTNFLSALRLILNAIIEHKLPAEEVEGMVLTILSDMQIDNGGVLTDSMMHLIKTEYADAGMKVCGKPYSPPHILFWNLRSTDGFPTLSTHPNASMMSGFSPSLLNLFCDEGMKTLKDSTPWTMLVKSLSNPRYDPLL